MLIPTYNNATTVGKVISDVSEYTKNIIVVNDGSTDNTSEVLRQFDFITVIDYKKNVGKGWAMRQGFKKAMELNYDFAITIDSDGQHFASDLPVFLQQLSIANFIFIGARNMNQDSVPGKSSFGNKFSNFWFKIETGITMPDTQSGYRMYPLHAMRGMNFFTKKYEFEIEVLVRCAWRGIKIESVPVKVFYAPKEERISHFRPFKDFTRISILNTVLVILTIVWIKPRDFIRSLFKKETWQQLNHELFHPHHSPLKKALSVTFGVFMGIVPIWGFQLIVAIFLSVIFRLNKLLVIASANISIPPMIPVIIFLSYQMGKLWMGNHAVEILFNRNISLETIQLNLKQYLLGSITLAVVCGVLLGLITFVFASLFSRKKSD